MSAERFVVEAERVVPAGAVDGPVNAPLNALVSTGVQDRRDHPRLRIATSPDGRIADLIRRYPDVSSGEKEELRRFIDAACPIEVQRLRSDARLRPLFDRAARDIRGPLYGRGEIISAFFLALLFLASCWLLWSTTRP